MLNLKKNKKVLKIIIVIIIVLLAAVIFLKVTSGKYYKKMNIQKGPSVEYDKNEIDKILASKEGNNNEDLGVTDEKDPELSEEEKQKIQEDEIYDKIEEKAEEIVHDENVLNILLIGTDERGDVKGARSDTMMLASINEDNQEIILTSFMRDMAVSIPKYGQNKLNAAYAYGGADLLKKTLHDNFNINVEKYIQIDFESFISLFDLIKGIEVEITEAEKKEINKYIDEINFIKKRPWGTNNISNSGKIILENGDQALSYARIRKVGNSDFQRTERQRELIVKALDKIKDMNIIEINEILEQALPLITTNLTEGECMGMLYNLMKYKDYEVLNYRIPIDGSFSESWIGKQQMLKINFNKNKDFLKNNIYKKRATN